MKRFTAKILSVISVIAVFIICCLFIPSGNTAGMTITFLIYVPISIYLNYCRRCKKCGRWPRKHDFWAAYCPGCGEKLDD